MTITENPKSFQHFNFEKDFLENENLLQKDWVLVESTKIENASFPYKTAISEVNVKTNKVVTIKWTHQNERSCASDYFIFLKILFQFKNLLQRVDSSTNNQNAHICTFCKRWSFT